MSERRIKITAADVVLEAELNRSRTADLVWDILPISATASTWGDEIYFSTPIRTGEEDAVATVEMGAVAYWPPGRAICLFFGPTPLSVGDEIRPASPVNVIGSMEGDVGRLASAPSGASVTIERA